MSPAKLFNWKSKNLIYLTLRDRFFSFHYFFRFLLKYQAAIFDQFFPSKKCFRFLSSNFVFK